MEGIAALPYPFHEHPLFNEVFPNAESSFSFMDKEFENIVLSACSTEREKENLLSFLVERRGVYTRSIFRNIDDYPRETRKISWKTSDNKIEEAPFAYPTRTTNDTPAFGTTMITANQLARIREVEAREIRRTLETGTPNAGWDIFNSPSEISEN